MVLAGVDHLALDQFQHGEIEIAIARGKRAYDKRATIAKRDQAREQERETRVR